jgi:hypothetical protein
MTKYDSEISFADIAIIQPNNKNVLMLHFAAKFLGKM